jgi:hypothetical protein
MNFFTNTTLVSGATFTGKIRNNTIGTTSTFDSGSATGNAIRVNVNGRADSTVSITTNQIREVPNAHAVEVIGRLGDGGLDLTLTGNTVAVPTGTNQTVCGGMTPTMCPSDAFYVEANSGNNVCANVSGNTANYVALAAFGAPNAYRLKQGTTAAPGGVGTATTFRLEGTNATAQGQITATNTGTPVLADSTIAMVAPGTCAVAP